MVWPRRGREEEVTDSFFCLAEESVMWQGKTYLWRPHDMVEGEGEVPLKTSQAKVCFTVSQERQH